MKSMKWPMLALVLSILGMVFVTLNGCALGDHLLNQHDCGKR